MRQIIVQSVCVMAHISLQYSYWYDTTQVANLGVQRLACCLCLGGRLNSVTSSWIQGKSCKICLDTQWATVCIGPLTIGSFRLRAETVGIIDLLLSKVFISMFILQPLDSCCKQALLRLLENLLPS
jgi:hypothetical protein